MAQTVVRTTVVPKTVVRTTVCAYLSLRALPEVCLNRISELQSGLYPSASACEGLLKTDFRIAIEILRPYPGTPAAADWASSLREAPQKARGNTSDHSLRGVT